VVTALGGLLDDSERVQSVNTIGATRAKNLGRGLKPKTSMFRILKFLSWKYVV